jgi:hypothetical protein
MENQVPPIQEPTSTVQCPICGSDELIWGRIQADSLAFVPADASFLDRVFAVNPFNIHGELRAAVCQECGFILMFHPVEKQ